MTNAPVDPRLVEFVRQRRKAASTTVDPKMVDFVRQRRAAMKPQTPVEQPGLATVAKAGLASGTVGAVTGVARMGQSAASFLGAAPRYLDTAQAAVVGRGVQAVEDPIGAAFGVAKVNPDVAAVIESNVTAPDRASEVAARQIAKPMRLAGDIGSSVERGIASAAGPKAQVPYSKEWFAFNAGQMVPQIAASIGLTTAGTVVGGPGVGLAAGFGSTFAMEGGDQAKSIYDAEIAKGTDPESAAVKAFMPSVVTGLINAGIEQMGIEALIRTGQLANGIRKSLASWFAGGVSEGVQEGLQGNTQRMYADTAWNPTSAENLSQTGQESVLGATMGMGSAVPAVAADTLGRPTRDPAPVRPVVRPVVRPPAPARPVVQSPTAQAAADRLRQSQQPGSVSAATQDGVMTNGQEEGRQGRQGLLNDPAAAGAQQAPATGPLIPPGQQPSEQDLADARAIITRDPSIVTQPSRFRAEYLAARKRRAQPARPFAYTDNPDLATVLGADQIGLTNIRTQRGDSNAAQRAESGGGTPGAVAVRGPDVPAAPAPAVQDRAVSPSDQGRGVEGAAVEPAPASPVDRGVGEVVGDQRAEVRNQPGDVGVDADSKGLSTEALFERRHRLAKPIKGKSGASIVGYRWMSQLEEGPTRDRRVSDWSMSQTSEPTGRSIVHLYLVQDESGKETLMGIGAAQKALGISESRLQSIAKREAEAQRNRARQDDQTAATIEKNAATTPEAADAEYRRVNDPSKMMWGTPEERVRVIQDRFNAALVLTKRGRFIRTGDAALIDTLSSRGWSVYDGKDSTPTPPPAPAQKQPAAPAQQAEAPAVNYADDIPINVAVGAFTNTSHTPEKRGQARREEYAATLKSAREELDKAAVTPEQKAIADAEFARYRDGMKRRMLDYLRAHSRVASAMITGPANFPTERNRKAGNAADKRLNELVDFDKRARAAMMKAVRGAATPEMMASEESARLEKRVQRFIDHAEDPKGGATSLFKSNLQGALERAAKNGETTAVANALRKLRDWQTSTGRTIFTNRSSIWKLADISEKAVEEAAAAPTGEQEVASYTDGTRVVRNFDDDRVRIFFPGKPSDAQRTTLKSRGFKWSPANGAWQRQNTANGYLTALDLMLGFGKQKNEAPPAAAAVAPTPPPAPAKGDSLAEKIADLREKITAETNDRALDDLAERAALLADGADRANRIDLVNLAQKYKQQAAEKAAGIRTLRRVQAAEPAPTPKPPSTPDPATTSTPAVPKAAQDYAAKFGVVLTVEKHGIYGNEWDYVATPENAHWYPNSKPRRAPVGQDPRNIVRAVAEEIGTGESDPGRINTFRVTQKRKDQVAAAPTPPPAPAKVEGTQATRPTTFPISTAPSYRDWRTIRLAANAVRIVPNVPGTKFTSEQVGAIVSWAKANNLNAYNKGGTSIRVAADPRSGRLDIEKYGAAGVKIEAANQRAKASADAIAERAEKNRNAADARESAAWMASVFGEDFANGYNRIVFADWLEGKTTKPSPQVMPNSKWEPGLRSLGAIGADDKIDWQVVRRAYDARSVQAAPAIDATKPDPATLPRPQLVRLAKERGVDTKGTKKEIAERLKAQTASSPEQQTTTPEPAATAQAPTEAGVAERLDAIADRAKERLEKRAKKQRGTKTLNAGLNPEQVATALRDTVDLSIVGAAKAAAAGVRAGRALTKIVDAAIAEMGRTVSPKVRAIIQKNVRKILAESGGDPDKFEKVVSDLYNAPVTKKDIRAQAKARKQAAASITNPGENAAPVSQADALRGRLKAAEQTGEKVAKSAAAKIVQATRQGYQRGRRDERRTAIANMQGVVNDIKRERGRLRSLAQFEKRAGEVAAKMTADDARRAQMIRDGIRKQVVQYARTLPKEVRGKLVGRIATADTPVKMIQTVRELQRELMRHDGREAWKWIKKNARSTAVDKLKGVTNDLRKGVADLYAKAASAKRRIDAAETLKDSSIALAELQNLQAEIGLHITTAKAAFKAIKGQRQQSAFQIATNAADIIAKRFAKRSGDGVSQIRGPKRWRVRKHLDSYNDLRNMLAELEGDDGPLFVAIWESLEEGSAEYSTIRRDMRAEMERSYIRAGFKSMADAIDSLSAFAGRGVEKKYTVTVGGESKTLSLGEISSLIAHNSDPETAALIASEFGMRFTSPEGTGNEGVIPTPNEIKAMAAAIEKDYKLVQLVDDFKAILEKRAPQTLRTVGEITGIEPRRVEKRWTRSRDMEMVPGMEDKPVTTVDPSMVNVIRSFAENMGIYEHRTQTTGIPILLKDVHSVMEEEIHKQAATLALARRVRDAMLILTQDQLGKAIINAKGVEFYRALKRQVMAAGRTEVVYATDAEKAVGFLKGSAAVKYLAANPSTYIGNLLGTLRVLPDVDARDYAAGIKAMTSMSRAELEQRSGYLWDRWEQQGMGRFGPSPESTMDARMTQAHTGFQAFLREIGRQVRNSMKNAGRGDLGAGLTNLRMGSAAFMQGLNWVESRIAAFTWGAMDAKVRREQPELSDKAREKVVEKFVRREVRETQNGGDPVDAASIATQNRSSAASMVMFLLSDVMKVRNRVKRAFRQSKTYGSKVLAAEAVGALAKAYAVKYLWDSIAFVIAGALGDDDDKDRIVARMKDWTTPIERSAQDLFQILVPIGGPDLASLIDALRGRYNDQSKGGPVAMLAPLYDAGSAGLNAINVVAKSIENDDMNAEKIGLALAKFFDETTSAFGLNPLSPWTHRALREIVQTRKSEWW